MPYTMVWHADLSALVVRYEGSVSADEYRRMCAERAELLDKASSGVSVVVDMQQMQAFPDAKQVGEDDNVLRHENVQRVLIVLDGELYEKLAGSVVQDAEQRWPVRFFASLDDALAFVQQQQQEQD